MFAKQVVLFIEPSPQSPALLLLHTFIIKILILKAAAYLKITMNNAFLMAVLYSRYNLK